MRMNRWLLAITCLLLSAMGSATAATPGVYTRSAALSLDEAYTAVYAALEEQRFWVVFEANMGKRMAGMAERWGDDYNRQKLDGIRAMVFCNIGWTNRIANIDPDLLALCPLHLALYEKDGRTTATMLRPTTIAAGSPGLAEVGELENELIDVIDQALGGE